MSRARTILQNSITSILVLCAVLVTATLVHREFFGDGNPPLISGHIEEWKPLASDRQPALGVSTAPVKIILFSDYQCPFCKDLDEKLQILTDRNPGKVAVIRYELPLTNIHPEAYKAAIAAKCAAKQNIHMPFQAKLFEEGENLERADWDSLAEKSGVRDLEGFSSCLKDKQTASLVDRDMATGKKLGFESVPILLINGDVVSGTKSQTELEELLSDALSEV